MFSPLRFSIYARDLEQAIEELSYMSSSSALSKRLGFPVEVRFGNGFKYVTSRSKTVRVRTMATDTEITAALNETTPLPPVDVVEPVPVPVPAAEPASSNLTGLQQGAFQDAMVLMRQKIADRQRQAVAKISGAVEAGAAKLDAAADDVAGKVDREISAALQEFAQYSNGGPA